MLLIAKILFLDVVDRLNKKTHKSFKETRNIYYRFASKGYCVRERRKGEWGLNLTWKFVHPCFHEKSGADD